MKAGLIIWNVILTLAVIALGYKAYVDEYSDVTVANRQLIDETRQYVIEDREFLNDFSKKIEDAINQHWNAIEQNRLDIFELKSKVGE